MARTRILSIFFVREFFVSPEPLLPFFKPSGHLSSCKKREIFLLKINICQTDLCDFNFIPEGAAQTQAEEHPRELD